MQHLFAESGGQGVYLNYYDYYCVGISREHNNPLLTLGPQMSSLDWRKHVGSTTMRRLPQALGATQTQTTPTQHGSFTSIKAETCIPHP